MKYWWRICCLLMALLLGGCSARADDNSCFVRILSDKEKMVVGDSCLLTVVAYAPQPFLLKEKPAKIRVSNGSLRSLPVGRQPLQQVVEGRYVYYALVLEQYVLRTKDTGTVKIPERTFRLEMQVQEQPADPFDAFFGRQRVRKIPAKAVSEQFSMKVVEKPRRTMMEMKRSGVQVL